MPVFVVRELYFGLWVAKKLLRFTINVRESIESHEYAMSQYMERTRPIHTVYRILGCVCLTLSTENEEYHSPRGGNGISEKRALGVGEWFLMERL